MASQRITRAAGALLTAVLLGFGTAACGGSSTPDAESASPSASESESSTPTPTPSETAEPLDDKAYIDELNEVQTDFSEAAGKLNLSSPKSPQAFQKSLEQLVTPIETLTSDLQEITPPAEVAEEHEQLISTMEDYRAAIEENVDDLSGSPQEVKQAAEAISDASTTFSTDFDGAIQEINSKLDVG